MPLIQKKICMVGVHGTGKTSLVRQFVHSRFADKYLSTVGVKIDRKEVEVDGTTVRLLLWDLEGRTDTQEISVSYLRGAAGLIFVADGTRRETYDQVYELRNVAIEAVGNLPSIVALNKADLSDDWVLGDEDEANIAQGGWRPLRTSAKTGDSVEELFQWLAAATLSK